MNNTLLLVLLMALVVAGFQGYKWKQVADVRGWKAEQAYEQVQALSKELADAKTKDKALAAHTYLSQKIVTIQGKSLSRADLLDIILSKALKPEK